MTTVNEFINDKLYSSLINDNNVNNIFEISTLKDINSILLKYKNNIKDGFIITTTPYFYESNICFYIAIIAFDSCEYPKRSLTKYIINIDDKTIDLIKKYLLQIGFTV
jgi:hypothetical protein